MEKPFHKLEGIQSSPSETDTYTVFSNVTVISHKEFPVAKGLRVGTISVQTVWPKKKNKRKKLGIVLQHQAISSLSTSTHTNCKIAEVRLR